jgi:hypothetical protein
MKKLEPKKYPFVFGADTWELCEECPLPCTLDRANLDCHRRFYLGGMVHCSYNVHGFCFLVAEEGCVFDNGGKHDTYWLHLLNEYFHNIHYREENEEFEQKVEEVRRLIREQIENGTVYLCRYVEEYYNRIMESGGGLSEEKMEKLDEAFLALLNGTQRKL